MNDPPDLTPRQMSLLRESLDALAPRTHELTRIFFRRLFSLDPALRLLFRHDMTAHQDQWIHTLIILIRNMHDAEQLAAAAHRLGRRHRQYGVHVDDYRMAQKALLWALKRVMAEAFTPELDEIWTLAYDRVASLMQQVDANLDQQSGL